MDFDTLNLCIALLLLGLTIILYESNHVFQYYFKFIIYSIGIMISATIFIPIMLHRPGDYRNANYPAWGTRLVSRLIGLRMKVIGKENIYDDGGSVVLINHQSILDMTVLGEIWAVMERCTVISKKAVLFLGPFGLATWLWGTVFIDRASKTDALAGLNKAAATITTKKAKICLFPEGTRHGGEKLLPFKKGAFHIAVESQAPIQPIVVRRYTFLDYKNRRFDNSSNTVISILPAIPTEGLTKADINSLIEKTYKIMSDEYDRLNSQT